MKKSHSNVTLTVVRLDCRIRFRARFEKNYYKYYRLGYNACVIWNNL